MRDAEQNRGEMRGREKKPCPSPDCRSQASGVQACESHPRDRDPRTAAPAAPRGRHGHVTRKKMAVFIPCFIIST